MLFKSPPVFNPPRERRVSFSALVSACLRSIPGVLFVVLCLPALEAQSEDPLVTAVVEDQDPATSSWEGERIQSQLKGVFKDLLQSWHKGEPCARFAEAKSSVLAPPLRDHALEGLLVIRQPEEPWDRSPTQTFDAASSELLKSLGPVPDRIASKVVQTAVHDEGFRLRVRLELIGHRQAIGRRYQLTTHWWLAGAFKEDQITLGEVVLDDYQLAESGGFLKDVTTALLPGGDPVLAAGGDYWVHRVDQIGESPSMGHHGVAVGDVNGDGLEDLYVACPTGVPNRLFIRQGDGTFQDVAHDAGVAWLDDTKGVLLIDSENDGDLDLVCAIGNVIVLCLNDGEGRFSGFVSMAASTPAVVYGLSAADFDMDGDLDIYATRYVSVKYGVSVPVPFHDANNGPRNFLMRNEGNNRFKDVTKEVGLDAANRRFSLMGVWEDFDLDGDADLYVVNDFGRNNLYRNDGGKFTDVAKLAGVEDQAAGMGASFGDVNGDGFPDLYVTNMFSSAGRRIAFQERFQSKAEATARTAIQRHSLGNSLFLNSGDGTFDDASETSNVRMGRWGWGAILCDLNLDGHLDVYGPNGFLTGTQKHDL